MASNSLKTTLPSLQSMKVPRERNRITENYGENFSRALRGMISTTHLYLTAFGSVTAQPPHPWEASDGPAMETLNHFLLYQTQFCNTRVAVSDTWWGGGLTASESNSHLRLDTSMAVIHMWLDWHTHTCTCSPCTKAYYTTCTSLAIGGNMCVQCSCIFAFSDICIFWYLSFVCSFAKQEVTLQSIINPRHAWATRVTVVVLYVCVSVYVHFLYSAFSHFWASNKRYQQP